MSIFGTFALMLLFGFSIDILSLLAITLSVGFLVDDAEVSGILTLGLSGWVQLGVWGA